MTELEFILLRIAGRENEIDNVVPDLWVDEDVVDQLPSFADRIERGDGVDIQIWCGRGHTVKDRSLIVFAWIANLEFKHKAVYLRLGKGVGALLIDRIFCGQHQEGFGQWISRITDGHLVLLHGFE